MKINTKKFILYHQKIQELKFFAENNEIPITETYQDMLNGTDTNIKKRSKFHTINTKYGYEFVYCIINLPTPDYRYALKLRCLQVSNPKKLPSKKILLEVAEFLGFDIEKSNIEELYKVKKESDNNYDRVTNTLSIFQILGKKRLDIQT